MYLHKDYDTRAVPRFLPVFNQVQHLDEQIDAIARGKYFTRKRFDRQLQKATDGFNRLMKQSEILSAKMISQKRNREHDDNKFSKDLQTSAKTSADINEANYREMALMKQMRQIKEFNTDIRLRDRLVQNNMKAFDRLQIIKTRQ